MVEDTRRPALVQGRLLLRLESMCGSLRLEMVGNVAARRTLIALGCWQRFASRLPSTVLPRRQTFTRLDRLKRLVESEKERTRTASGGSSLARLGPVWVRRHRGLASSSPRSHRSTTTSCTAR